MFETIDDWRRKAEKKAKDLQEKAQEKAKELDDKYKLKDKLDDGIRVAESAVKLGVETVSEAAKASVEAVSSGAQKAQEEFSRLDLKDQVKQATDKASEAFKSSTQTASEKIKNSAEKAAEKANEFSSKARDYYEKANEAYSFGQAATKATGSVVDGLNSTLAWIKENPTRATITTVSLVAGIRLGSLFPSFDKIFLKEGHWFFRSALLAYASRKLSERYFQYLKKQEELIESGQLSEAERSRMQFQIDAAKYVGAPLLGAFNIAAGVAIWSEIFSPKRIIGFPIDIILGGNPILQTVWLFSNGLICIHNGYEFIMMVVADKEEVQNVVRDIKGLLPSSAVA